MLAHDEVWSALDGLAERNGLSPSGLARRSGLDPTTFNKSKRYAPDGRPRWPSTESISKVLKATNTRITELFGAGQVAGYASLAVPMVGEAHAGFYGSEAVDEDALMLPRPPRIVAFPDKRHEPLYALSVVGDSMEPLYRDGDVLFIAPSAETEVGNRVVVKLQSGEVLVKVLRDEGDGEMSFHAVNPDHPDVSLKADEVEWMAKIVYATQ